MLNSKLVAHGPKHPTHGREPDPKQTPRKPRKSGNPGKELNKRRGSPIHVKPGSDPTPEDFGENTVENHMVGVLPGTTQMTEGRAWAITFSNLVCRQQPTTHGLPYEDFDLKRDLGTPNQIKSHAAKDDAGSVCSSSINTVSKFSAVA